MDVNPGIMHLVERGEGLDFLSGFPTEAPLSVRSLTGSLICASGRPT
jgi:hypothetical protein